MPSRPLRPDEKPHTSATALLKSELKPRLGSPGAATFRADVRNRVRDGVSSGADPVPFNMVRLEELTDQIGGAATPTQTVFQVRYAGVPTQQYMSVQVIPGTLVAYVDGSWAPTVPTADVDVNGNFTLPVPPLSRLLITYGWQYLSDGEIDQCVDEARQWLREFGDVSQVPDGLVPALVSYASSRALAALRRSANLANVRAGDSGVDWSSLAKEYGAEVDSLYRTALQERKDFYTQGPEALDPTAAGFSAPRIPPYTPLR